MMRKLLIAAALSLTATPALADWGATKWGMTLAEVLNVVPGARPLKREGKDGDVWKHYRLASAPWRDGQIALIADFYFDPDSETLGFVRSEPVDIADCPALEDAMIKRHGKGTVEEQIIVNMELKVIRWVDPVTHERLLFSRLQDAGKPPKLCHFIQQAPA